MPTALPLSRESTSCPTQTVHPICLYAHLGFTQMGLNLSRSFSFLQTCAHLLRFTVNCLQYRVITESLWFSTGGL